MKIIGVSNFNIETESDFIIAENVDFYYGEKMVNLLVEKMGVYNDIFLKLVPDDYKLYKFEY